VALGVYIEPDGSASAAGGFLVQAMPGADPALIPLLEERLKSFPPTTALLREGLAPIHILEQLFAGIPFNPVKEIDLAFHCSCSRPQVERMLRGIGATELRELVEREEETTVTCEFCKAAYHFTREELTGLADDKNKG
jgi:molecular chaperone Hsp33